MDTVTFAIDGRQLTVPKGKTVLQAAIEAGIRLPYYCYHPGIGVEGSCRVCLVKIEKMPKLQVSCSVVATEGMVVSTNAPDVVAARAGVFEFLLVNHPLDCPVCDKGGECPLQDFSYNYGPKDSRMEFERRTFDGAGVKADVDFGPTLMLNRNRCILCTRCVRFMKDVDGDAQIGVVEPRLPQRDRHVPRRGRALAAVRQPDGRVPGRRHHDARLPLQVASVGQPQRRRHDLHPVREGLQHDGLAEGEAGVGQGHATGPDDPAPQPRGQRLLDVRHRPLPVPLGRERPAAATSRRPRCRRRPGGLVEGRAGGRRCGVERREARRPPLPAVGARLARGDVRHRAARAGTAGRRRTRRARGELDDQRKAAARDHQVQGARGRRAERRRSEGARPRD